MKNIKNETKCVLVCVTPQLSCERLIKAGELIAMENRMPLRVLSVFGEKESASSETSMILEALYEAARMADASMSIYFNDSPDILAAVVAHKENAGILVTGFPRERSSGFIAKIHEILPDIPIAMVDENSNVSRILPQSTPDETVSTNIDIQQLNLTAAK